MNKPAPAPRLHRPWDQPPAPGTMIEVAAGVFWARLSLPMALDHVNVYALDDGDGWTIIDTGLGTSRGRAEWEALLTGPLAHQPVHRVVVTHHHPDHIGLAGWFQEQGAALVTTRTAWLYARMLLRDIEERPHPETIAFWRAAGMAPNLLAERAAQRPFNFSDTVAPLGLGYQRIADGQQIRMGGREWLIRTGDGHAPEHATFWEIGGNLVIGGDQLLPDISAIVAVHASEPAADPLAEWLDSTADFIPHARDDQLVLPGHKLPFTGLPLRLHQMIAHHDEALARLLIHLEAPRTASQCFVPVFGRELTGNLYGMALVEAVAHLNHLYHQDRITRRSDADGVWWWQRRADGSA